MPRFMRGDDKRGAKLRENPIEGRVAMLFGVFWSLGEQLSREHKTY
jgi:hypothetical protein